MKQVRYPKLAERLKELRKAHSYRQEDLNDPDNSKRFRQFSNIEKELIYYFEKISEIDKKEVVAITKMKAHKEK